MRNPAFEVSNRVRLKYTCSATETSYNIEIWYEAILNVQTFKLIYSKDSDQTGMCLSCLHATKSGFLAL